MLGALSEVLAGDYEERRATTNVQTREKHAIQYCMQWEHWGRFWQEIMRNGEQPLMSKRVKNTRYNTARSGSTEGGFGLCTSRSRDTIPHTVRALRGGIMRNGEQPLMRAPPRLFKAADVLIHLLYPMRTSGHVKKTRYNIAHSGSTEGGNYEELRVTTNVWTRGKHAIRWCPHCGHRVGFWRKLLRNSKCKRMEIHDRMVHAVVAPSGVLAGN
ncbi:hypothetical protein B0H11DRAFT_1916798 [Mycena galericulata]|nr:hypothetical protein B0H11DRAFT_1916798 [Mycena galericulata]